MIPLELFLLGVAAVYLGALEAAFSALMRLSLRLAAEMMGRHGAARAAYEHSRALLAPLNMRPQQVLDPVSGLVRVALAEGRLDEAMAHNEIIFAHLDAGGSLDGTEEPLLIPLTCFEGLSAVGDPRATDVLARAHAELQAQAARIGNEAARRGFLHHVPHHRRILAAWAAQAA